MKHPDYQGTLGFELVTVELEDQMALHLIREGGAEDREATMAERVLWSSLVEALAALNDAESILRYAPDISTNCMGTKPATTTSAALLKARAALKSNGWQA
jgi:hypothetical protein